MFLNFKALLAALFLCSVFPTMTQPALIRVALIRVALIESLSGPFADTGEAVFRNLVWATERVNNRDGVKLPGGTRPLLMPSTNTMNAILAGG